MKTSVLLKNLLWVITGAIVLTWSACYGPYFESIEQPEEAELESSFAVDITVACYENLTEADRIVPNIGLQLPDSWDEIANTMNTDYRLIFGIRLPLGWTVEDNFPFTGADTGIFSYSEYLSMEMNHTYPPGANYYWWISENPEYLQTSSGTIYFSPVITTGDQPGICSPVYSLGYWEGSGYNLYVSSSTPGLIYVGLEAGDIDIYVSPLGNDNNSGLTPEDPVRTITSALLRTSLDTVPPHTIRLAEGVYSLSTTGEAFPVELIGGVEIIGQGAGITILDGEFTSRLFIKNYNVADYFRHLTLTGGNAGSTGGGAIYCPAGGYLELEGVHLDTNFAISGGAIYSMGTTVRIKDALITRNNANYGGFAWLENAELHMTDAELSYNTALRGGTIFLQKMNSLVLNRVSFLSNTASTGGAIYLSGDFSCRANETVMEGNSSTLSGGGIYAYSARGTIQNISFYGNQARYGGAIRIVNSNLGLMNMCLAGNISESHGSAINSMRSDITASHLTISDNQSINGESMLYFTGQSSTNLQPVNLTHCNIWGNAHEEIRLMSVEMTVDHCNIQNGEAAFTTLQNAVLNWQQGNIDTDPMFEGTGEHPYQLSAGSPCIDAGRPDTMGLNLPMWDLLGNYRLWDGDGDGDTIVDIGAYEFGSVGVGLPGQVVPSSQFAVRSFPNPFTVNTTIAFELEREAMVRIEVFNFQGAGLGEITNQRYPAGKHRVEWNASGLPAGMYMIRVQTANAVMTKKVIKRH